MFRTSGWLWRVVSLAPLAAILLLSGAVVMAQGVPTSGEAEHTGTSPAISTLVPVISSSPPSAAMSSPSINYVPPTLAPKQPILDSLRQTTNATYSWSEAIAESQNPTTAAFSVPLANFEGVSNTDNVAQGEELKVPPDTVGDVGPGHFIQMSNVVFEIFDKTGNVVLAPRANKSLWQNLGGLCAERNDGDPIVLYDRAADRWLLSQFAIGISGHQCIAIPRLATHWGNTTSMIFRSALAA